jgi:hypothetical protein
MTHEHKFYLFETKMAFEPIISKLLTDYSSKAGLASGELYQRVEYAISGCSCGVVTKRKIMLLENEEL